MGKTLSKAGMRLNTRRQRSQMISEHQNRLGPQTQNPSNSEAVLPRELDSGVTIHTLKIQRDEFSIARGNIARSTKKEMELVKQLLLDGKRDLAQVLLKKKRFQQHILEEAEAELNYVLSKTTNPDRYRGVKAEADNCVNRNSEALKRIHMLLSVENIERILLEGEESQGKMDQVNRILLLATVGERKKLDHELDNELDSMLESIDLEMKAEAKEEEAKEEEDIFAAELKVEDQNLIDLEDYVKRDGAKKGAYSIAPVASADLGFASSVEDSKGESAEETEGASSLDGDDEKSDGASNTGSASDISSKMFPGVPENSPSEVVENENIPEVLIAEPETA